MTTSSPIPPVATGNPVPLGPLAPDPVVVALVPAKDSAVRVGSTVAALRALPSIDRIVVIDDGSSDETAAAARRAGADVVVLPRNRGKGGAVAAGVAAAPEADVYLLIDADLTDTAAEAQRLVAPVLAGDADMTIGLLPPAEGRGGFGTVKRLASKGVERASGFVTAQPLSGQRAVRAELLEGLGSASRFGLEVALTIDAVRAGARILEVPVPMEHRHTGRSLAGFRHRGRQGIDIARALWPRLVPRRGRIALTMAVGFVVVVAMMVTSGMFIPTGSATDAAPDRVVLFGVPSLALDDLDTGIVPTLDQMVADGGMAAMSIRTLSGRPSTTEAYASIGAGARVKVGGGASAAYDVDRALEGTTAGVVAERRTGSAPTGSIVIPSMAAVIEEAGDDLPSHPGALGTALTDAGVVTAAIGSSDLLDVEGVIIERRSSVIAVADDAGNVALGSVAGDALLESDLLSPYGHRADHDAILAEVNAAIDGGARMIAIETGDTDRAASYGGVVGEDRWEELRVAALARTDLLLSRLRDTLGPDTLLIVAGMTPPEREWELTPLIVAGAGVPAGSILSSTSTKTAGLVTLTDVSPTILDALDVTVPDGMIGAAVGIADESGRATLGEMQAMNDIATAREAIYYPIALTFVIVQALLYLAAALVISQSFGPNRSLSVLKAMVLVFACWPLATFLLRATPAVYDLGAGAHLVLWIVSALLALGFAQARRYPLSPLSWIAGTTSVVLLIDISTGATLQSSSILGYSPHTAARFTGFGNTAFAVLAATALIAAALHIHHSPRPADAWWTAGVGLGVVLIADAAPTLGADVGGILTLVPVFGLLLYAVRGSRITVRTLVVAGVLTVLVVGVFAGLDLARGAGNRTHLGDFVAGIFDGDGQFWTTISRKWATNLRVFQNSFWTWMVPITSAYLVYVLVIGRGWQRDLPERSVLRHAVVAVVISGVLGWLVNDSGVVVAALVFVYIGPFLTLSALERFTPGVVVLDADDAIAPGP